MSEIEDAIDSLIRAASDRDYTDYGRTGALNAKKKELLDLIREEISESWDQGYGTGMEAMS